MDREIILETSDALIVLSPDQTQVLAEASSYFHAQFLWLKQAEVSQLKLEVHSSLIQLMLGQISQLEYKLGFVQRALHTAEQQAEFLLVDLDKSDFSLREGYYFPLHDLLQHFNIIRVDKSHLETVPTYNLAYFQQMHRLNKTIEPSIYVQVSDQHLEACFQFHWENDYYRLAQSEFYPTIIDRLKNYPAAFRLSAMHQERLITEFLNLRNYFASQYLIVVAFVALQIDIEELFNKISSQMEEANAEMRKRAFSRLLLLRPEISDRILDQCFRTPAELKKFPETSGVMTLLPPDIHYQGFSSHRPTKEYLDASDYYRDYLMQMIDRDVKYTEFSCLFVYYFNLGKLDLAEKILVKLTQKDKVYPFRSNSRLDLLRRNLIRKYPQLQFSLSPELFRQCLGCLPLVELKEDGPVGEPGKPEIAPPNLEEISFYVGQGNREVGEINGELSNEIKAYLLEKKLHHHPQNIFLWEDDPANTLHMVEDLMAANLVVPWPYLDILIQADLWSWVEGFLRGTLYETYPDRFHLLVAVAQAQNRPIYRLFAQKELDLA